MGIGGIGIWQLVIILVIVVLLFGTKKLKGMGGDLGGALKGFKKAMGDKPEEGDKEPEKVTSENAEEVAADTEKQKEASSSETKS